MFVGEVAGLGAGFWIGVKLDEPLGDSNGKVGDIQHFEAADKFGLFIRPKELKVGDYPEKDEFGSDDEI